jgi:hypothetical protein
MLEKERDDACDAVDIAEEEGETAEVINHLMNVKADTKFKIWLTGLVAEDTSDKRDEIMKKDLRKLHCFLNYSHLIKFLLNRFAK